jgi:glyoxylase-like metal-dependent hydrolase (beta-lactamase superfamily II)
MEAPMIVRQIEVGWMDNFSYVIGCEKTGKAMVVDPGADVDKILAAAEEAGLTIETIVNTHGHGDHTAGNAELKSRTGATVVMHEKDADAHSEVDRRLSGKENRLQVGEIDFRVIHTPGHTPGGICLYAEGYLFTGDTLFVGDSGRTDLAGGHRPTLGASIRRLMELPEDTIVCPGHDYGPTPTSTLGWEKRNNVNAKEYGYFVDGK